MRAFTKRQMKAVVWIVVLGSTVWEWPSLCSGAAGHVLIPQFLMVLVPTEVRVGASHSLELSVISEPSLQRKIVAVGCYDT